MLASDAWASLAAAAPGSRVVLRLVDGTEIDVDRIEHFAGIVVVTPAVPVSDEIHDESLEPYRELTEEYDDVTPAHLRRLLESSDASTDDCASMLATLTAAGIDTPKEVAAMIAIYDALSEHGIDTVAELHDRFADE